MSEENVFLDGLMFKLPSEKAPDYVKGKISIKREALIATLSGMTEEWINLDLLVSKGGKPYAKINDWKKGDTPQNNTQKDPYDQTPEPNGEDEIKVEDIPF